MKDNSFYLPILKWKTGEKGALKKLSVELKQIVIPLVEFVKKEKIVKAEDNKTVYIPIPDSDVFRDDLQSIRESFSDMTLFVDTKLLTDVDRENAVVNICQKVTLFDNKLYPVVYLSELENVFSQETKDLLNKKGYCLRVSGNELKRLDSLMLEVSKKQKIHLVFDFGVTDKTIETFVPFIRKCKYIKHWKSITLASGAAPKYLTEFDSGAIGKLKRLDWLAWNKIVDNLNGFVSVNYGDFVTRFPIFENIHNPNTSFSFRYTGDENWFIFRGFSKKSKHYKGYIQYRAHAVNLVDNKKYQFSGESFSNGDTYVKSKAKLVDDITGNPLNKKCGNATTWLQAGINHHICKVVDQLINEL